MGPDLPFRVALLVILALILPVSIHYRRRARRETAQIRRGEEPTPLILARMFIGLPGWLLVFTWLIRPEWVAWARLELPDPVRWFGAGVASLMIPLAWWLFPHLGRNVSETVLTKEGQELVTTGPYHWIRHPLYTGGVLLAIGVSLLAANWLLALFALGYIALLPIIVRREEEELQRRFGPEFARYRARTGRFLPKLAMRRQRGGGSDPAA